MSHLLDYFNSQITSQTTLSFLTKKDINQIIQFWIHRKNIFSFLEEVHKLHNDRSILEIYQTLKRSEEVWHLLQQEVDLSHDSTSDISQSLISLLLQSDTTYEYNIIHKLFHSSLLQSLISEHANIILYQFRNLHKVLLNQLVSLLDISDIQNHEMHITKINLNKQINTQMMTYYDEISCHYSKPNKALPLHTLICCPCADQPTKESTNQSSIKIHKPIYVHCLTKVYHDKLDSITKYLKLEKMQSLDNANQSKLSEIVFHIAKDIDCLTCLQNHIKDVDSDYILMAWKQCIETALYKSVLFDFKQNQITLLINIIRKKYTQLIDAQRPQCQKIGSLYFGGKNDENITVVFLTRDGELLAQRDYVWNTDQPSDLKDTLDEVKVKSLVISQSVSMRVFYALEGLKSKYQIHYVSPIGLNPVVRPLNLTPAAQKAIRLGQRYVAPLRYWARVDVLVFVKSLLPTSFFDLLYEYDELNVVREMMELENSIRWIALRKTRASSLSQRKTKKINHDQTSESSNTHNFFGKRHITTKSSHFKKGMPLWVHIVGITPQVIHVETLQHNIPGIIDTRTLSTDSKYIKGLLVDQKRKVFVQSYEPKTQQLTFSFKSSKASRHNKKHTHRKSKKLISKQYTDSDSASVKSSIHLLNSMFKKK
jgi:hypothetical protein